MTAVVLKEQADPERFVDQFSDGTRDIYDYLARDVLATADPAIRDFMAHSSVLDILSAPLCDAVLERTDSAIMLTELERSNLFVIPLDATGSEYRYHHLFAAFLTRRAERHRSRRRSSPACPRVAVVRGSRRSRKGHRSRDSRR